MLIDATAEVALRGSSSKRKATPHDSIAQRLLLPGTIHGRFQYEENWPRNDDLESSCITVSPRRLQGFIELVYRSTHDQLKCRP